MVEVAGTIDERFAAVGALFERNLESGVDVGASVCVLHRGEPVVDLWGGWVDEDHTRPWEADTIVNVWSTTKTMTFLVALMLADRGELDLHAPVARCWPEFAAEGKADITVANILAHTAGLPGWSDPVRPEQLPDWDECCRRLAAQAPWWEDRTRSGYHALTQGYLIGEIVRRVTGTTIGSFFASEVAGPLGADFLIGVPESAESRVALVIPPRRADGEDPLGTGGEAEALALARRALASSGPIDAAPLERWWRAAEIPAANGHGNARSIAAAQAVITGRGEANGVRLLSEEGVERLFEVQARGTDLVLGIEMCFGM
ncbi:MAG: beta-lactamase family protein, partial [Acidimicrobiia bacterium]|nr:beta-lactamase family protein [Acidimicrobiia bacterium]